MLKLAPDQVHASPLWADGKLFVPMFDGKISVVVDEGDSGRILGKTTLDGACLAPRPPPTVESSSKPKKGFIALDPICRRRLSLPSLRKSLSMSRLNLRTDCL